MKRRLFGAGLDARQFYQSKLMCLLHTWFMRLEIVSGGSYNFRPAAHRFAPTSINRPPFLLDLAEITVLIKEN